MYGCGATSRGQACTNRVALEEADVDAAVKAAVAKAVPLRNLIQPSFRTVSAR
jgi:hypothetical protein